MPILLQLGLKELFLVHPFILHTCECGYYETDSFKFVPVRAVRFGLQFRNDLSGALVELSGFTCNLDPLISVFSSSVHDLVQTGSQLVCIVYNVITTYLTRLPRA